MFIGDVGGSKLLIVLVIAVLLFGANRLPRLARSSGQAMGEFRKGREEVEAELRTSTRAVEEGTEERAESA